MVEKERESVWEEKKGKSKSKKAKKDWTRQTARSGAGEGEKRARGMDGSREKLELS